MRSFLIYSRLINSIVGDVRFGGRTTYYKKVHVREDVMGPTDVASRSCWDHLAYSPKI